MKNMLDARTTIIGLLVAAAISAGLLAAPLAFADGANQSTIGCMRAANSWGFDQGSQTYQAIATTDDVSGNGHCPNVFVGLLTNSGSYYATDSSASGHAATSATIYPPSDSPASEHSASGPTESEGFDLFWHS